MSSDKSGARASDVAIRVRDVSKHYVMFNRPEDRFKQMIVPRLERLIGRPPRRYFRDFAALSGVSFEVGHGETVGIIGRNGSGKSTLLQIICGTLQPTSGSVEVNGRIAALLELGAGFNPEFTGRENVFLNASILGVPRKEMEWRFDDIVRFADIGPFIDQPVKTYSSGMYVRLAFATAINVDPDILIVDEALSVGDEAFQRKCFARIEDIKDKGGTILFVSHGAPTIVQLCTRAILLDSGEKILEGRPKTVVSQYQRLANASSEAAYDIRNEILQRKEMQLESVAAQTETPVDTNLADDKHEAQPNLLTTRDESGAGLAEADYTDSSLVTRSMVSLEERGAGIRDLQILTQTGHSVNTLKMGQRYIVQYRIVFEKDARDVGFGFGIRSVSGVLIAGTHTHRSRFSRMPHIAAGSKIVARFEFSCLFVPGTYFISCGVRGRVDGEEMAIHRLIDGFAFRVAAEADLISTGQFDLDAIFACDFVE
ncbi:ABC transporter ATP-binding protein [Mesorhizobium sanjuanii]|uniref:ABC transporter ATP-binding protein n=1 Tax=Mesorhizobium sanjuanii TaxID=2037900 RepID=A0A2A6F6E2_9HYPH|nr:ABC transporter ATP-binding protein [Mesorhizobium sanjuanii]PDQ17201.1 ABC transporter ATP-binding protein [Mesorhizobium sanjuanii]